jgi:hypothetical protein
LILRSYHQINKGGQGSTTVFFVAAYPAKVLMLEGLAQQLRSLLNAFIVTRAKHTDCKTLEFGSKLGHGLGLPHRVRC